MGGPRGDFQKGIGRDKYARDLVKRDRITSNVREALGLEKDSPPLPP